jgi:hypothetical protein
MTIRDETTAGRGVENASHIALTRDELTEYTGKVRPSAQARVLDSWGIPHRRRPDGSLAVLHIHVEMQFAASGAHSATYAAARASTRLRAEPTLQP